MRRICSVTVILLLVNVSYSLATILCPPMPTAITEVNRDAKSDINASAASLGKVKAVEVASKIEVTAKNLFAKYPNVDKLLTLQTMTATYCTILRDSTTLSDKEKLDRWEKVQEKVLNLESRPTPDKQARAKPKPKSVINNKDQNKGTITQNTNQPTSNSQQNHSPVGEQAWKTVGDSLIKRDGKDVLIHESIAKLITNYDFGQPVYIAYGEPGGCGAEGNVWMQNLQTNVTNYILKKEGSYFRAKDMVNLQFQIVQLKDNKAGNKNIKWARLERKSREMGEYYFNGFDCTGGQRTAIWVTESKKSNNGDNAYNFKATQPLNERD